MTFRQFALRALFLLTVVLLLALLWSFRTTWMLVFLALIIAVGVSIPVSYLRRLGLPRSISVVAALLGLLLVVAALGYWLVPSVVSQFNTLLTGDEMAQIGSELSRVYSELRERYPALRALLPASGPQSAGALSPERLRELASQTLSTGLPVLFSGGSLVATLLANLFLVGMLVIFFLAEPKAYLQGALYLVPARHHERFLALMSLLYHTLRTWLSTLTISITITVTLVVTVLGLLGMPNVFVVAVFAGLATFVPNIGAILPVIPIVIFSLADDPSRLPLMVLAYLAVQGLESNVLTPSIVRRQLSIPPAATLVTQILAASLFGVLGVLLAVPLLAVLITLVRELYSYGLLGLRNRSLQVVLPEAAPHARDTRLPQRTRALRERLAQRQRTNKSSGKSDTD